MNIALNDLLELDDGLKYLVVSKVYSGDIVYLLLIDSNEYKRLFKEVDGKLYEIDFDELDMNVMRDLITMMDINLEMSISRGKR